MVETLTLSVDNGTVTIEGSALSFAKDDYGN